MRRPPRLLLITLLGFGLLLTACTQAVDGSPVRGSVTNRPPTSPGSTSVSPTPSTQSTPSTSPSVPATPANFYSCDQVLTVAGVKIAAALKGKLSASCARYSVPLDYADPSGTKTEVFLLKIHDADNTRPTGTLLVNPGGPGASGVELALGLLGEMSPKILQHFDLLGFDPRGVGLSTPIKCISDAQKDKLLAASPDVSTSAGFIAAKANAKSFAEACEKNVGAGLKDYNTVNTARDMDRIRQAVGDEKMNYLGFSYGTELGSVYAQLFPDRIRVAVLDGAVDPLTSGTRQFADQLQGFESAFNQFAASCAKTSPCTKIGNARATVASIQAAATRSPLKTETSRPLTTSLATTGVLEALYSKDLWDNLGTALTEAKTGNGAGLLKLADQYNQRYTSGQYANISDANTTIGCNDSAPGPSDAAIRRIAADWTKRFPLFGKWSVPSLFSCQQWQPVRVIPPRPTAVTAAKVLVIGNLHDPATPYQGAKDMATTMGNAELLSWNGEGHTSYLQGSTCIDNYVNNYLISQQLPPKNTTCPR